MLNYVHARQRYLQFSRVYYKYLFVVHILLYINLLLLDSNFLMFVCCFDCYYINIVKFPANKNRLFVFIICCVVLNKNKEKFNEI